MIRRILLASSLVAFGACVDTTEGSDTAVGLALGTVQVSLEAQSALLAAVDSCANCVTLQDLGNHVRDTLGACATVSAISKAAESDQSCEKEGSGSHLLIGKPLVRVDMTGCDLGLGRPVSGKMLVTQADGSVLRYYETDLVTGDHGVASCGQVSGAAGGHSIGYNAVAHGPTGGDVFLYWNGPASVAGAENVRSGVFAASFTAADGIGYEVDGEASSLSRTTGDSLPHAGRITFAGIAGRASLEFGAETPTTGGIRLTRSDGVQETVIVAR